MITLLTDLAKAHDEVSVIIQQVPDRALDWQSSTDEWSLKQTIGHLAHANDFYIMIVTAARATVFGTAKLHPELAGWKHMATTDAAVAQCTTTLGVYDCFEHTYQLMLTVLRGITHEELDRPFVFCQPDREPYTTTLRQRVVLMATNHLREHKTQLSNTLAGWQAIYKAEA